MLTLKALFAGGGGDAEGATRVPGVQLVWAANHWPVAVATHALNHPDAEHVCADLTEMAPRRAPRTDLMWASPACTHHTIAQGARRDDDAAVRSRATMWAVVDHAEATTPEALVVENVVEVMAWACWPSWVDALHRLGYRTRVLTLNSAHLGDRVPQSRDRLYLVASRDEIDLSSVTSADCLCPTCGPVRAAQTGRPGRYGRQWRYTCPACRAEAKPVVRSAREVIDWTNPGTPVADRYKPRTRDKITLGLDRYAGDPFIAELRGGGSTVRSIDAPLSTITASGTHHLLVVPHGEAVRGATARMLTADELARAQGFPDDYRWLGTRTDQVRMVGGAVSTTAAEALIGAVAAHLRGVA